MAIHPTITAPTVAPSSPPSGGVAVDVQAWTEQASEALSDLSLDHTVEDAPAPAVRGTSTRLNIVLDEPIGRGHGLKSDVAARASYKQREPLRRDSLSRREALLKGKEGSRQRRRWENDRLLSNPWVQPPLPSDWQVGPTYRTHTVPYYLAPLWDAGLAAHAAAKKDSSRTKSSTHRQAKKGEPEGVGRIPREFKEKMKKSKGAKGLLQDLETEVRNFVEQWQVKDSLGGRMSSDEPDSEEDEVVFVGRDGEMQDRSWKSVERELLLFDSPVDDQGATFCRYLVHHIGSYYGLKTWSVTTGSPARREAYVGFPMSTGHAPAVQASLPRPLWGLV